MLKLKSKAVFETFLIGIASFFPSCFIGVNSKSVGLLPQVNLFDGPEVYLTIRATAGVDSDGGFLDRLLELNWYNIPTASPANWVGLLDYDPLNSTATNHYEKALFKIDGISTESGSGNTSVRFERVEYKLSQIIEKGEGNIANVNTCVGYWVAYFEEVNSLAPTLSNCLKLYPRWMNELREEIGDRRLSSIMIPGTHNAGAWRYYEGRADDLNAFIQYTYNQEDSIYEQLLHGIRYLDVRVGYQGNTEEKFWIYHSARIRPLITLLQDVKTFVLETNEIVLMDFHRFVEGFVDKSVHDELVQFILSEIGELLISESTVGANPIVNDIWNSRKNVLWTYADDSIAREHDFIWPYLRHAWGDKNVVEDLRQYLNSAISENGCRGSFWSSMAELTPTTEDIIFRPLFGLRKFAQLVNMPVTDWYRNPTWYSKSNIISTDFYLGNNIIEMSLRVNKNRASCSSL